MSKKKKRQKKTAYCEYSSNCDRAEDCFNGEHCPVFKHTTSFSSLQFQDDPLLDDANREMFGDDADFFKAAGIDDIGNK